MHQPESRRNLPLRATLRGCRPITLPVNQTIERTPATDARLRHGYPYFLLYLNDIRECVEGGCSVRSVWRAYAQRESAPFPGSYSAFLRYCRKHGLARGQGLPNSGEGARLDNGGSLSRPQGLSPSTDTRASQPAGSILGRSKLYPPPLERPPTYVPTLED